MISRHAYRNSPLTELLRRLERSPANAGTITAGPLRLIWPAAAIALLGLYLAGILPAGPAWAGVLAVWLLWSGPANGRRLLFRAEQPASGLTVRHAVDFLLLSSAGLGLHLFHGAGPAMVLWSVAAALSLYLAYYTGAAFLKALPASVRNTEPEAVVRLDHLFLAGGSLWGAERRIVFGCAALGLAVSMPAAGMIAAVSAVNIYWLKNSWEFWKRAGTG